MLPDDKMDLSRFEIIGQVTGIESIALNRGIRELQNLRKLFGPGRWRKLKGIAIVRFENGLRFRAEVHWYEAHGIGRRKLKIKQLLEELS
jgi:hypothetical protein